MEPLSAARERLLEGLRVVDLTNVLAGPYASYQLALLGADVIKVEVPGRGDLARQLGPDASLNEERLGSSFLAQNAGKRSVELDLRDADDRASFEELVGCADVLIENYRAGVLARLDYSWDVLRDLNPRLIYCAITGFGADGPMSGAPAYDQIIQGLAGIMSITGDSASAPLRTGFPVCDTLGGLTAAFMISAAVARRERTGMGAFLDVSMLEASLSAMGWPVSNYLVGGQQPRPMGNDNATAAPSGTFHTRSGLLNIAANRQTQYETLCRIIGRNDLVTDERFVTRELRKANRAALNAEINLSLASDDAVAWAETLSAAGVPAAPVIDLDEALELSQVVHRGFVSELPFPAHPERTLRVTGAAAHVDGQPVSPLTPPPTLGASNDALRDIVDDWSSRTRPHEPLDRHPTIGGRA